MSVFTRDLNVEFSKLHPAFQQAVYAGVQMCWRHGNIDFRVDTGELLSFFKYPKGVAWGVIGAAGWNLARGAFFNEEISE